MALVASLWRPIQLTFPLPREGIENASHMELSFSKKQYRSWDTLTAEHETNQQTELDTPPLLGKNELVLLS